MSDDKQEAPPTLNLREKLARAAEAGELPPEEADAVRTILAEIEASERREAN